MSDYVFETILERLEVEVSDRVKHIGGGACTDFSEYKHKAGIIYGFRLAVQSITDLREQMERE